MNSLEQAALSGALTTVKLNDVPDPDGREPDRSDEDEPSSKLLLDQDQNPDDERYQKDGYMDDLLGFTNSSGHQASSQIMSRGWSGNTGPKGVLLDFKASHGKSGAILGGGDDRFGAPLPSNRKPVMVTASLNSCGRPTKKSGRISTPTSGDSDSDSDQHHPHHRNRVMSNRLGSRLIVNPQKQNGSSSPPTGSLLGGGHNGKSFRYDSRERKLFGHLREVGVDNFVQAVEAERDDRETVVLVHLYDPALESCVILNSHLSNLARLYPRTKFLRALASELDFFSTDSANETSPFALPPISPSSRLSMSDLMNPFGERSEGGTEENRGVRATDSDVLPTLIWYRAGEYVQSLPALERELPSGLVDRGEKSCREIQTLLHRHGIISDLKDI